MAQMTQELPKWPTVDEAAAALQTSRRTIFRHAQAQEIEIRKRRRKGKPPESVCNPRDLERLMPAAHVMPSQVESKMEPPGTAVALRTKPTEPTWPAALEVIASVLTGNQQNQAKPNWKLWLTLDEAAEYSGLPRSAVADFAAEGRITAMKRGAWFVNRASLEAFAG